MVTPEDIKTKTASAYTAAADCYDAGANTFWKRFGKSTVEKLEFKSGARVLDVCCGSGASAFPAVEKVGADGSVLGVDLAEGLVELAQSKAIQRNISNVEFRVGDMLELDFPDEHFDAVICVFGIFFVPDMPAAVKELWRMVSPGGVLAITTWGENFFEPANSAFWHMVAELRPDLHKEFNPWDRIAKPDTLRQMLADAGLTQVDIVCESAMHPLGSAEDWWIAILGSGYRGTIEQLSETEHEHLRNANLHYICENKVDAIEANVIYATVKK